MKSKIVYFFSIILTTVLFIEMQVQCDDTTDNMVASADNVLNEAEEKVTGCGGNGAGCCKDSNGGNGDCCKDGNGDCCKDGHNGGGKDGQNDQTKEKEEKEKEEKEKEKEKGNDKNNEKPPAAPKPSPTTPPLEEEVVPPLVIPPHEGGGSGNGKDIYFGDYSTYPTLNEDVPTNNGVGQLAVM